MNFDNYENAVLMPRWEISDPFGRGAIRKARWEYTKMKRERDALKNQLEAVYDERGKAVNMLIEALHTEQKRVEDLKQMIAECDKARKSLGEKLNAANADCVTFASLAEEWQKKHEALLVKHHQLEVDHETLLRSLTDGGAVE